jgi:hypothetical protein
MHFCIYHRYDFQRHTQEQTQKIVNDHGQVLMIEKIRAFDGHLLRKALQNYCLILLVPF